MPFTLKKQRPNAQLEHSRLTTLINSMADAVIAVDEHAKVVQFNGAALNILDTNSIRLGTNLRTLFKPVDADKQVVDISKLVAAATTPMTNRDLRLPYSDGSMINLYISIAPVHLGYGEAGQRGHVVLLRDITREKSLEEERDEFISVVSHELRTPIAISEGNISNAEFIVDKTGDIGQVKLALKAAHDQILFLADMINDLSTLSRAERGVLKVEPETIDVPALLQQLEHNYQLQAAAKGLTFSVKAGQKLGELRSGQLYVREILQNFITNSLKYTKQGGVTLTALPKDTGIEFQVTDTGIGISKNDQARVFDKFFRSEDYRTRETNGTGLGLYVTAKLARLIKADISLDSKLDEGSTFTIFVPDLPAAGQSA